MATGQHTGQPDGRERQGSGFFRGVLLVILLFLILAGVWVFLEYKGFAPVSVLPQEVKSLWEKTVPPAEADSPVTPSAAATAPAFHDISPRVPNSPQDSAVSPEPPLPVEPLPAHNATAPAANATAPAPGQSPSPETATPVQVLSPDPSKNQEPEGPGRFTDLPPAEEQYKELPEVVQDTVTHYNRAASAGPEGAARGLASGLVQVPPPTTRIRTRLGNEDKLVRLTFVDSLARYLAESYWPRGMHPHAQAHGISTMSLKWANAHYGLGLEGFSTPHDGPQGRAGVLNYVLMPSMINALSRTYMPAFLDALKEHGQAQIRGGQGEERPLTGKELAEMYGIYALKASSLASTIRAYLKDESIALLTAAYLEAEKAAHEASGDFFGHDQPSPAVEKAYQTAVVKREQAKSTLASAIRRNADTRGLDEDSLVFVACWLQRRPPAAHPALTSLAAVLTDAAGHLERMRSEALTQAAGLEKAN